MIAREGLLFVGLGAVMAAGLGALGFVTGAVLPYALSAPCAAFALFCCFFFRDPERALPDDASKIYSPGDGTVLSVAREGPGELLTVRIFLSIFDVHIQRFPCSGTVSKVHYQTGSFKAAMVEAAKHNERNVVTIAVAGREAVVIVEQIAGLIARRIRCWTGAGEPAVAGTRYGLIQFGSQAAVHMPASVRPLVRPGDKAVGGVTPIAEWS